MIIVVVVVVAAAAEEKEAITTPDSQSVAVLSSIVIIIVIIIKCCCCGCAERIARLFTVHAHNLLLLYSSMCVFVFLCCKFISYISLYLLWSLSRTRVRLVAKKTKQLHFFKFRIRTSNIMFHISCCIL